MINATHKQYDKYSPLWKLINDIVDQDNVEDYLIELNPTDVSDKNKQRNISYRERAVFYALTEQTVRGMLGSIFSKTPEFETESALEYLKVNCDGLGNSIYQQSQQVTKNVTSISRDGLYISYPKTDGAVSKADINSGKAVAIINRISADRIINWDETSYGAISKLSLVVFSDVIKETENYKVKETKILRELYLDNGTYKERKWKEERNKWVVIEEVTPLNAEGLPLSKIPFKFAGSVNNDTNVDNPNMLGLAKLNVAHFRNSADYEDSVWFVGQAQSWMSNVNQSHIDLMTKNNMYIGSRDLMAVPEGGAFGFASAPPNPLVRQAMIDKVDMMIGIGARMITPGGVAKTAEQSSNERETQHSTMTLIAENVSEAYSDALIFVGWFMGVDASESKFELNNDFIKKNSTPAELKEIILGFMSGAVPVGDYVRYMKDSGVFDEEKSEEDYISEIESASMPEQM